MRGKCKTLVGGATGAKDVSNSCLQYFQDYAVPPNPIRGRQSFRVKKVTPRPLPCIGFDVYLKPRRKKARSVGGLRRMENFAQRMLVNESNRGCSIGTGPFNPLSHLHDCTMSVSLRLPEDLNQRLGSLAAQTGRSKTFYMLEAIKQHIDELEDLYLAEQRLLDVRAGRSQAHSLTKAR